MIARSLLFVPGDSPRKLAKSFAAGADLLILDLEDSVASERKEQARALIAECLRNRLSSHPTQLWVRLNALDSPEISADLAALAGALPDGVVVPKVEGARALERLDETLAKLERDAHVETGRVRMMPILETPRGVLKALDILNINAPRIEFVTWGAEDMAAALGMQRRTSNEADALRAARTQCLLIASALRAAAIETVATTLNDSEGLREVCRAAAAAGFSGMLAIHPNQVAIINEVFSPSQEDIDWARRVVAALAGSSGAATVDGRMIDIVHGHQAERILRTAQFRSA